MHADKKAGRAVHRQLEALQRHLEAVQARAEIADGGADLFALLAESDNGFDLR